MKKAVVDFETYYDDTVSVDTLGLPNYVGQSNAYIVSVSVDEDIFCGTISEMEEICCNMAADPTLEFWAAHSNFDNAWWNKYFPPTAVPEWQCVLDLGAYHQLPRSLAKLAKVALGIEMDKGTRSKMKGIQFETLPDTGSFSKQSVEEYCLNDVRREAQLIDFLPPMSSVEAQVAAHTRMVNRRGVHIDQSLVEADKTKLEVMRFEALKKIPWHEVEKPLSYNSFVAWCGAENLPAPLSLDKRDDECTNLMSDNPRLKEIIETLRRFRKANTLLKKLHTLQTRLTNEGILPLDMLFCAAPHTRRWSSQVFNVQNLDKQPTVVTEAGDTIWTRNWIIPPPGKKFLVIDFAQVEPRILNWMVGNQAMMDAIRAGYNYYEAYARFARNWSGAPGTIKAEYGKAKYTLLKNEALGLGYGMGWKRFIDYAAENKAVVEIGEAKNVVNGFRMRNPLITANWRALDLVIISAAFDPDQAFELTMPSGDLLKYFSVRQKGQGKYEGFVIKGDFGKQSKQQNLWGGTLTENVVQRIARDILAVSILRLEDAGFPVAFHAHDEVILVVDANAGAETQREAENIMCEAPEWADGLPLGVGSNYTDRYTKF